MKILIIGLGSIGHRHVRNFRYLAQTVLTCDSVRPADMTVPRWNVDAVVIATPPATHLAFAQAAAERDLPMLIEKPLGLPEDISAWEELRRATILVGYQWRYAPELQQTCAWPWRSYGVANYQGALDARESTWLTDPVQGGGVLLEYSHAIDYALWACHQNPLEVLAMGNEHEALLTLNGGFPQIHLSFNDPTIGYLRLQEALWSRTHSDLDACYLTEARHFLAVIAGTELPQVTLDDGLAVLEVVKAARRSFQTHRWERTAYGERCLSGASAK